MIGNNPEVRVLALVRDTQDCLEERLVGLTAECVVKVIVAGDDGGWEFYLYLHKCKSSRNFKANCGLRHRGLLSCLIENRGPSKSLPFPSARIS